jgi:hypothetical protein
METILDRAREAGMAVMLKACIGREHFHSIAGSRTVFRTICAFLRSAACGSRHVGPLGRRSVNAG